MTHPVARTMHLSRRSIPCISLRMSLPWPASRMLALCGGSFGLSADGVRQELLQVRDERDTLAPVCITATHGLRILSLKVSCRLCPRCVSLRSAPSAWISWQALPRESMTFIQAASEYLSVPSIACGHIFCSRCLTRWKRRCSGPKFSCPTCRAKVGRAAPEVIGLADLFTSVSGPA